MSINIFYKLETDFIPQSAALQSRRNFIKHFTLSAACAGGALLAPNLLAGLSASVSSLAGVFRLTLDDHAALKSDLGSVLVKVPGMPSSFPQIIVTRLQNDQFAAVTSKCTHMGCTVGTYTASAGALACPCHGSRFSPTGEVVRGPAALPLAQYVAEYDGSTAVNIQIPGLGFTIAIATVAGDRLQITFPTVTGVKYDVRYRSALATDTWQAIPFATAVDSQLVLTTLNGTGAVVSLFVARNPESGFFVVTRS